MGFGDKVWDRSSVGEDVLAERTYIAAVSGFTVYGLLLTVMVALNTMTWTPGIVPYLIVGLGIPIVGIIIALVSDYWPLSLLGYTLLVGGLGAIIGPTVALFETGVVLTAVMATLGVTVVMALLGIAYPKSLEGWGGYLFGGLTVLLLVRCAQLFMASQGVSETTWYMPWIEYGAGLLFCLYIIYDWNRAVGLTRNLDNAVDCALAIYLDIINLFLILLRLLASKDANSR